MRNSGVLTWIGQIHRGLHEDVIHGEFFPVTTLELEPIASQRQCLIAARMVECLI